MSRELLKRALPELIHFQFANDSAIERHNKLIADIKTELAKPEPEPEPVCFAKWEPRETAHKDGNAEINAERYKKLRRWMSSNVLEGWQAVKSLAAIAVWEGWDAFDSYLDEMPECNVGLCQTGENNGT